jgi:(2S)-methylsuccinyl-CoA dehydrogenase
MTTAETLELERALDGLRRQVASAANRDGRDARQVDVDRLVWCHAHVQAAGAMADWAGRSRNPLAAELAAIAHQDALAALHGRDAPAEIERCRRLAAIARRLTPLEDVGASEEHRLLRSTLRGFAEKEIRPHAQAIHRQDADLPEHIIAGVARLGLFGLSVPTEYGGVQESEDFISMLIATEELSRASLAAGGSLMTRPEILVRALLRGGTEEQKRRWLPAIASGEALVGVAVTEPDHGSDVAAVACRATRLPSGGWQIDGTKLWSTFAGRSELLMVLCRTGQPGHRGLSVLVVEKPAFAGHEFEYRQPEGGVLRGRAIPTIGYRGMHTFELAFEGFRAPAISLVGGEPWLDRGFYLQMEGFSMGRVQTAGRAVGVMQAALDSATAHARERIQFGRPIFDHQLIASRLGEMAQRLHASRQLSYRAARLLERGQGRTEASLAKLYASRMAEAVTREATQVHGAMGYGEETDVSRHFVDSRVLAIFEGAEEVLSQRVIGPALLQEREDIPRTAGEGR